MSKSVSQDQLGFDMLLQDAEADNRAKKLARETAHLPGTMEEAVPHFRGLIEQNHAAMLAGDAEETRRLHEEARKLAEKQVGADRGILAHDDAPGYVLARETAADPGMVPLWGQTGRFVITVNNMRVRINMDGMFGIGAGWGFWPGFSAHAVDWDKPFLSQTGYRSFLGIHANPTPGLTPETFAEKVISGYVERELRGKLVPIGEEYRARRRS